MQPATNDDAADVPDVLIDAERIAARVAELGAAITADYATTPPLLVGVLKGAFVLISDLAREIRLPVEFDFMAVASYAGAGGATQSSGIVRILKDLDVEIAGRHVLVVEDVVDSGLTLQYLLRNLGTRSPASLDVCAFLVKRRAQRTELPLRYVGFEIPDEFVVGYGLDLDGRYRQLPYVGTLRPGAHG